MPESKNKPQIKKLQGGVIVPYNIKQVTRTNEENEQETFYIFQRLKLEEQQFPNLEQTKKHIAEQLRKDLHAHIYLHYDGGAQATIQVYAVQAQNQDRTGIYDECEKIMNWIDDVLTYYCSAKDNVLAATDEAGVTETNWDFVNDKPASDDLKSFRGIKAMW